MNNRESNRLLLGASLKPFERSSSRAENRPVGLLLHLQHHSGPVCHVALQPAVVPETFRMVLCTAEQLFWRELELLGRDFGLFKPFFDAKKALRSARSPVPTSGSKRPTRSLLELPSLGNSLFTASEVQGWRHDGAQVLASAGAPWQPLGGLRGPCVGALLCGLQPTLRAPAR